MSFQSKTFLRCGFIEVQVLKGRDAVQGSIFYWVLIKQLTRIKCQSERLYTEERRSESLLMVSAITERSESLMS